MKEARHHMIDFIDPLLTDYTVVDFRNKALPIVESLYDNKVPPLIVGGTSYYIESLIYNVLINPNQTNKENTEDCDSIVINTEANGQQNKDIENIRFSSLGKVNSRNAEHLPSEVLFKCLQEVDPERADEVHPMEKRKII